MLFFHQKSEICSKMVTFLFFATPATVKVRLISGICILAIALTKQTEEVYELLFLCCSLLGEES